MATNKKRVHKIAVTGETHQVALKTALSKLKTMLGDDVKLASRPCWSGTKILKKPVAEKVTYVKQTDDYPEAILIFNLFDDAGNKINKHEIYTMRDARNEAKYVALAKKMNVRIESSFIERNVGEVGYYKYVKQEDGEYEFTIPEKPAGNNTESIYKKRYSEDIEDDDDDDDDFPARSATATAIRRRRR